MKSFKWDYISLAGVGGLVFLGMFIFISVILPNMLNINDTFINIFGVAGFIGYLVITGYTGRFIITKWKEVEDENSA